MDVGNQLPRELGPGLYWLGSCELFPFRGDLIHSGNSLFLIIGEEEALLVEAGLPNDHEIVLDQLRGLLEGGPPLRHIWMTHQETPHAGGVAVLLEAYPEAIACGNIQDYHLFFPELADRFEALEYGEEIDLGGTQFRPVEPVIRDLITTQWGFDTRSRALFAGDGFAYAHHHGADQCGHLAEEVSELDIPDMTSLFTDQSLTWARYTSMEPYVARLEELISQLDAGIIAPTHGLPATDVAAIMPRITAGLLAAGGIGERFQGSSS